MALEPLYSLLGPPPAFHPTPLICGLLDNFIGKESAYNAGDPGSPGSGISAGEGTGYPLQYSWAQCRRPGFDPWLGKIPWRRERLPTPVFWPGEFHGPYISEPPAGTVASGSGRSSCLVPPPSLPLTPAGGPTPPSAAAGAPQVDSASRT